MTVSGTHAAASVRPAATDVVDAETRTLRERVTSLETANRALIEAWERAEAASRSKNEFLSRVSHELRTPLNAVLGLAQVLARRDLSARDAKIVEEIVRGGRWLLNLVNDLLDISRVDAGRLPLSLAPVGVGKVINDAVALIPVPPKERGVELNVEIPDPVPPVIADTGRLCQVLVNLLSNAVKFNRPRGRVTVSCTEASHQRVAIHVTDTGVGIARADLERVFHPFERGDDDGEDVEGIGLGLSVARALTEAMGGSLEVRSQRGVGSTFSVLLPAAPTGSTAVVPDSASGRRPSLVERDDRGGAMVDEPDLERAGTR
jgi:signal transduction histidine kinase